MLLSRCCRKNVYVVVDMYYVCTQCNLACDTLNSLALKGDDENVGERYLSKSKNIA